MQGLAEKALTGVTDIEVSFKLAIADRELFAKNELAFNEQTRWDLYESLHANFDGDFGVIENAGCDNEFRYVRVKMMGLPSDGSTVCAELIQVVVEYINALAREHVNAKVNEML